MKFLCGNCKAKYQIPDEKVAGKTLRMRCHKCGRDIIVGPKTASSMPPSAAGQSSALGAMFEKQLKSSAPPPPPAALRELDQWHVAINEVPVGPIKREEVERKIHVGAVTGDSLCWRDGFDDWKPLRDVIELASLLRRSRPTPMGQHAPAGFEGIPLGTANRANSPAVAPTTSDSGDMEAATSLHAALPAALFATAPSAPAPVRAPTSADDVASAFGLLRPPDGTPLLGTPASEDALPKKKEGLAFGKVFMIGAGVLLAVMVGAVIAVKMIVPPKEVVTRYVEGGEEGATGPDMIFVYLDDEGGGAGGTGQTNGQPGQKRKVLVPRNKAGGPANLASNDGLTPEQREMLARMGKTGGGITNIHVQGDEQGPQGPARELTPAQLSAVVMRNRPGLTRCYEQAFRGRANPPAGRIDVGLTVSGNGRVTAVRTNGGDAEFAPVRACIERGVRQWAFPPSTGSVDTTFPLVFTQAQ